MDNITAYHYSLAITAASLAQTTESQIQFPVWIVQKALPYNRMSVVRAITLA